MLFPAKNLELLPCEAREASLQKDHFYVQNAEETWLHPTPRVIHPFALVLEQGVIVKILDR